MHFATYQKVRHRMRMELKRYLTLPEVDDGIGFGDPPLERAALLVVRVSERLLDWDNAYGGIKPLQDCLVPHDVKRAPSGLGLIADDNPGVLPHPPYILQRLADAGCEGYTDVFVFALSQELAPALAGDQLALPAGSCESRQH